MPDLIVNVDHTAAFRNLTSGRQPDPVGIAVLAEVAGAIGVSARFTEDRRQISDRDIRVLRETVQGRFSLGVAPTPEMMGLVLDVKRGSGAFLPDVEDGLDLARTMVGLGAARGCPTVALMTASTIWPVV